MEFVIVCILGLIGLLVGIAIGSSMLAFFGGVFFGAMLPLVITDIMEA